MRITKEREERKQEIIEASKKLFLKQGYQNTSVDEIVKEINVAKGLFYYYFNKKSSVLLEIGSQILEEVTSNLNKIEKDNNIPDGTKLNMILSVYMSEISTNEYFLSLIRNEVQDNDMQLESELKRIASLYVLRILEKNKTFMERTKYPKYVVTFLISGFSGLYTEGIKDPSIYRDLIFEFTGIKTEEL